jgi:hypothetical protein
MHEHTQQHGPEAPPRTLAPRPGAAAPSSSRMFASYLADIEQSLDNHRRETALREASDLPRLAVALAHPNLSCTSEQVRNWCTEWLRPPGAERDAQGLDCERLERAVEASAADGVPMRALRRLQLRRHLRTHPRGFPTRYGYALSARDSETVETCGALLAAARLWYARSACHDPVVQDNLARLAVLR